MTREENIQKLIEMMKISSDTNDAIGVRKMGDYIQNELKDIPLVWEKLEHEKYGDMLFAKSKTWDDKSERILLSGHLDTVYNSIEPFDIRHDEEKLYGPGSVDMKGGLLVMINTIKKLHNTNQLKNIGLIFTPEEELGKTDTFPKLEKLLKDFDTALVFEGDGSNSEHSENNEKSIVVQRNGIIVSKITAKAAGGHSGSITKKENRHSAVHELVNIGNQILNLTNFKKGTTTNIGVFNGGSKMNILSENGYLEFEARVKAKPEFKRIISKYSELINEKADSEVDLEYKLLSFMYPLEYKDETKSKFNFLKTEFSSYGIKLSEEYRGGGSDANKLVYYNPKLVVLDNFGPRGGREHSVDEFVYIDSLEFNTDFTIKTIILLQNIPSDIISH